MYLAPLNYDRFFKKIFSDTQISKRFLEDFFDIEITEIEHLKLDYKLTDDANVVRFDFRCKIEGRYVIIDMQQWYKQDIVQRFYLYHAANTVLQLEHLSTRSEAFRLVGGKKVAPPERTSKNYREIEPVITLIWMVHDKLGYEEDYIVYRKLPSQLETFVRKVGTNKSLSLDAIQEEANGLVDLLDNNTRNLSFLGKNKLIFAFQGNIIRNNKLEKYQRWFEFAAKTLNKNNEESDFSEYLEDKVFEEMIRRLKQETTKQDANMYLYFYHLWEDIKDVNYEDGKLEGIRETEEKAKKEMEEMLKAEQLKAKKQMEEIRKAEQLKAKKEMEEIRKAEQLKAQEANKQMIRRMLDMNYSIEQIIALGFERSLIEIVQKEKK